MGGLLISLVFAIVIVGIVCAVAYYVPWPPPLAWMRWVLPLLALLIVLVWFLGGGDLRLGH